jgi:bifunctional non-homologous end joining protein LigD
MTTLTVGRRRVEVSHPDKVLFPDGITKAELADYYASVADVMVPHARGRPVMMQRFPDGIGRHGFVQKEAGTHAPGWVHLAVVPKERGSVTHVTIEDAATLVWLADQACITPHVFLSRTTDLDHPDRMVIDIDPGGDDPAGVRSAALLVREVLDEVHLPAFAMATGSRGLHVVVPLDGSATFDDSRTLARGLAEVLVTRHPEKLTVESSRAKRRGRIYLDVMRNAYAQTAVAPYAVRAVEGAPVAMPLEWHAVEDRRFQPRRHTLRTAAAHVREHGDAWSSMQRHASSVRSAQRRLDALQHSGRR